jgi:hypothetical protein
MRRRPAAVWVAALATLAVAASGCADEGDVDVGRSETSEQPGTAGPDDPRSESELRADEEAAEAMLPTLADLPPGWEESATPEEDVEDEELNAEFAACLGVDLSELDPINPDATRDFTSADDEEIRVGVAFTPSPAVAHRAFEILNDDAVPRCFGEAVRATSAEGLPEGVEVGDATFNRLSFAPLGDESLAFRLTLPMSAEGFDVDLFFDWVFVRVGRIGIEGLFESSFAPFEEDSAAELMQSVIDRAPAGETG